MENLHKVADKFIIVCEISLKYWNVNENLLYQRISSLDLAVFEALGLLEIQCRYSVLIHTHKKGLDQLTVQFSVTLR